MLTTLAILELVGWCSAIGVVLAALANEVRKLMR